MSCGIVLPKPLPQVSQRCDRSFGFFLCFFFFGALPPPPPSAFKRFTQATQLCGFFRFATSEYTTPHRLPQVAHSRYGNKLLLRYYCCHCSSNRMQCPHGQMVRRVTTNHEIVGSSPTVDAFCCFVFVFHLSYGSSAQVVPNCTVVLPVTGLPAPSVRPSAQNVTTRGAELPHRDLAAGQLATGGPAASEHGGRRWTARRF